MRRFSPYIGVTGCMSQDEVRAALNAMPRTTTRKLMVGVLASSKTLAGGTNKYPNRYPPVEDIVDIFVDSARVVNLLHYATDDRETLGDQLKQLEALGGPNLHGFQVNVAWPDPKHLFIPESPNGRMVLQINRRACEEMGNDPERVAERIDDYHGRITDVLFDASGGRGLPLDVEGVVKYLRALEALDEDLGLGVAGGLDTTRVGDLKRLLREFPHLSMDAENRLRTPEDHLDPQQVAYYLSGANFVVMRT